MLKRTSLPDLSAIDIGLVKKHLKVDHDDDDQLIEGYIAAAVELIESETTRILTPTTFELRLDDWPCGTRLIELPVGPVREVMAVTYIDEDGDEQSLSADYWDWERTDKGGDMFFDAAFTPPALGREKGALRIGFEAGHYAFDAEPDDGDASLLMPRTAWACILLITADFYARREATATDKPEEMPLGVKRMIPQLRIFR